MYFQISTLCRDIDPDIIIYAGVYYLLIYFHHLDLLTWPLVQTIHGVSPSGTETAGEPWRAAVEVQRR